MKMLKNEPSNIKTGQIGEDLACKYLAGSKGYRILKRNYWKPWGEIDIVCRARDNTLVFVEVKTMRNTSENSLVPEDQMSASKLGKLQRTCRQFAAKNGKLVDERRGWRIDLVAIDFGEGAPAVRHYESVS